MPFPGFGRKEYRITLKDDLAVKNDLLARLYYSASIYHYDDVCPPHCAQPVGDDDDGPALHSLVDRLQRAQS